MSPQISKYISHWVTYPAAFEVYVGKLYVYVHYGEREASMCRAAYHTEGPSLALRGPGRQLKTSRNPFETTLHMISGR